MICIKYFSRNIFVVSLYKKMLFFSNKVKLSHVHPRPPQRVVLNIKIPFREGLIVLLNLAHFLGNFKVIFTKFKKLRMFPVMKLWLCMGINGKKELKLFHFSQPTMFMTSCPGSKLQTRPNLSHSTIPTSLGETKFYLPFFSPKFCHQRFA